MTENDIIRSILQYEKTPPPSVWDNIARAIQPKDGDKGAFYLNAIQKKVLVASSILASVLCAFLFNFIQTCHTTEIHNGINYTTSEMPQFDNNTASTKKSTAVVTPFPTIINSAAIDTKNHLIARKNTNRTSPQHRVSTPQLLARASHLISHKVIQNNPKTEKTSNLSSTVSQVINTPATTTSTRVEAIQPVIENQVWLTIDPMTTQPNSKIETKKKETNLENIFSQLSTKVEYEMVQEEVLAAQPNKSLNPKIYVTPYIGGNFTQIFYQGSPSSPYFGENVKFTGKIGYNFGAQIGYSLSRHWSIESGIGFGQYIESFKESTKLYDRKGVMYIDQLDFPLMARYSLYFGSTQYPKSVSFKGGLLYNSVTRYQVNYTDIDAISHIEKSVQLEADKRNYNSLQMGYMFGVDFDAFLSRKISLNLSMVNSIVSQLENFPLFRNDIKRPIQISNNFSIGIKFHF